MKLYKYICFIDWLCTRYFFFAKSEYLFVTLSNNLLFLKQKKSNSVC